MQRTGNFLFACLRKMFELNLNLNLFLLHFITIIIIIVSLLVHFQIISNQYKTNRNWWFQLMCKSNFNRTNREWSSIKSFLNYFIKLKYFRKFFLTYNWYNWNWFINLFMFHIMTKIFHFINFYFKFSLFWTLQNFFF